MTKRALIVIAILILIPIIIVAVELSKFKSRNTVVAEYGGSIDVIKYDGLTLHRVDGEEDYNFLFGDYLGKVGDALTGAALYLVKDDMSGGYYAIADGNNRILYTESGKLIDGVRGEKSRVTRVVFNDHLVTETDADRIETLTSMAGKKVSVDMSEYPRFESYDLYLAFDGSAIVTEHLGRLILLAERDRWIFVSAAELDAAEETYGSEMKKAVYTAELITDTELERLLTAYFTDAADDSET